MYDDGDPMQTRSEMAKGFCPGLQAAATEFCTPHDYTMLARGFIACKMFDSLFDVVGHDMI